MNRLDYALIGLSGFVVLCLAIVVVSLIVRRTRARRREKHARLIARLESVCGPEITSKYGPRAAR